MCAVALDRRMRDPWFESIQRIAELDLPRVYFLVTGQAKGESLSRGFRNLISGEVRSAL
jgi:hypothetical protein